MCVWVLKLWGRIVLKGAVGRNPVQTLGFVDERKSPSNVGSFYPRCLTAALVCAA